MSPAAAENLVEVARDLYLRGLSPGTTGNLSVRIDETTVAMTPTDSCLGYLTAAGLSLVDVHSGHLVSGPPPTKEAPLHLVFYAEPTTEAVVHLHSPWATALCCLKADVRDELARLTPYFRLKVAPLALIPYTAPGAPEGPFALRDNLGTSRAALLRNHGTITAGATLLQAINKAEEIEHSARVWFTTRGHDLQLLPIRPGLGRSPAAPVAPG